MSLIWRLYYINLEKLKNFCGGGDISLVDEIANKYFRNNRVPYENLSIDCMKEAIQLIAAGNYSPLSADVKLMFPLALEAICFQFGIPVEQEGLDRCRWDWIDEMEILEPLIESGPPIPIKSGIGESVVGYLTPDQVKETISENKRYDSDDFIEPVNGESQEILADRFAFISWLKEAKPDEAIISFLY